MDEFLEKNKLSLGLALLGIILIGLGLLGVKIFNLNEGTKVEILGETDSESPKEEVVKITVEIAGEVIKPGVYQLTEGSRVNDLLTTGGGLSANADRNWVEKNINLAQKLVDGAKIYIPAKNEAKEVGVGTISGIEIKEKININTASEAELDTLWGIGPATAKKIIQGRPYQTPDELLKKKIIKTNVWEAIKDRVTVY